MDSVNIPTSSTLAMLDPTTLANEGSGTGPGQLLPGSFYSGGGLPATNDGRYWAGSGSMEYFTLTGPSSWTVTTFATNPVNFMGGPFYEASRDGERLIITQTDSLEPGPPMLYMNAADSVLRTNPAGLTASNHVSMSEQGDRALFYETELRDAAFSLIGSVTLPAGATQQESYGVILGLVTPDGSRVYVLAYRNDAGDPTLGITPRVFVFDATTVQPSLNLLGYFDIADYPGIGTPLAGAISLDGRTLFMAGTSNLVIVPVPSTLSTVMSASPGVSAKVQRHRTPAIVWPLTLH
jgi:hypothetical protein